MDDIDQNLTNGNQPDTARDSIRQSRELVPVTTTGVQIHDLAQQIDYARTMAKARAAVPQHLRDNVGDCLAIIDISSRAGLSPYMVAQHTYVQNNRLCFESQLYHAFLQSSGLLRGDIEVSYQGEGGERTCTIKGYLRADPEKARTYTSPPLKDRHPGYVLKKSHDDNSTSKNYLSYAQGEKMRADGEIKDGAVLHSRGSPLWVTKPDVQQFYDTSRDWTRMFCPRATLGIYTPDEIEEFGPDTARDVTPSGSGLSERLRTATVDKSEGHKEGHAAAEMSKAQNGDVAKSKRASKASTKAAGLKKEDVKTIEQWKTYCLAWLKEETDYKAIRKRWDDERSLRNTVGLTADERMPVQNAMLDRCKELGEQQ